MSYFIATCKYEKMQENGAVKRVSEKCLCDALSIVEAVETTTANLQPYISGEFEITKVERTPIAEVMGDKESDKFYLAKVAFITIDERSGKEKKAVSQMLVGAQNFTEAYLEFGEAIKGTMADFDLQSLAETPIKEFYPAKL